MSSVKEFLIRKMCDQTTESFSLFHNNVPTAPITKGWSPYLWGNDSNGFFLHTGARAVYLEIDTGQVHRISKKTTTSLIEFEKHQLLSTLATTRMDIPIHYEEIEINETPCVYTIVQRPNKQLGSSYFITCGLEGKDPTVFFNGFITEHVNLLELFPKVASELGDGLPEYCDAVKYWEDDKGLFATDFKYWSIPQQDFIEQQLASLARNLTEWNLKFTHAPVNSQEILETASIKWRAIDGY